MGNIKKDSIDINKSIINVDNNIDLILSCIAVDELNGDYYNIIIINTNPKQNFILKIYLISSHYVIFLMRAEKWTVEGFETLRKFIKELARLPGFIVITGFKKHCP
ncbi:AAA family ATPase [Borreliella garinii]|uniref:AAA family ATPase n=1 Tax=Borreliella garinii TaxID=29519 RepID=UPI002286190B|nr:AAA family ATPase [Borreliella garinii]